MWILLKHFAYDFCMIDRATRFTFDDYTACATVTSGTTRLIFIVVICILEIYLKKRAKSILSKRTEYLTSNSGTYRQSNPYLRQPLEQQFPFAYDVVQCIP